MCYKRGSLFLAYVVVLFVVSVEPSMAQINYDEYNYWWAQRVWLAGWPPGPDVVAQEGEPVPKVLPIIKSKSDILYGETAKYAVFYRKTGPGAGMASISTSATFGAQYNSRSGSFAYIRFGIGLDEPTTLEFILRRTGDAGSANLPLNGPYPAGPPSNLLVDLSAGTANGGPPAQVSLVWGPEGQLPGQSPTNPISSRGCRQTNECDEVAIDNASSTLPPETSGDYLTSIPVDGDYGYTASIYFGGDPASAPTAPERAALGYGFISQGLNIASVVLPGPLPNGDSQFELLVDDTLYSVSAGSTFDFTSLVPGGVENFALLGIDPTEGLDPTAQQPFPVGLQFAGEGVAQLYTLTYSALVPGDFNEDGVVDAADYVVWKKGLGTDYTLADYDVWRAYFGETSDSNVGSTSAAVPEPTSAVLGCLAAIFVWQTRRPAHR